MDQSHSIESLLETLRRVDSARREKIRTTVAGGLLSAVLLGAALGAGACSGDQSSLPDDADPQLQTGERIWLQRCANCHGLDGGGAVGPKLADGEVTKKYEDPAVEKSIIQNGINGNEMPPFKDILTDEEIDAVVAYTRDAL